MIASVDDSTVVDATIYIGLVSALTQNLSASEIIQIINDLRVQLNQSTFNVQYTSVIHILELVLIYADPSSYSLDSVIKFVETLTKEELPSSEFNDLEEIKNWLSTKSIDIPNHDKSILKTASAILTDTTAQCQHLSFILSKHDTKQEIIFKFVKAKVLRLSHYYHDAKSFQSLFKPLQNYEPFKLWYNGLVQSYIYYWDNYGSLNDDNNQVVLFKDFLNLQSLQDHFTILIYPVIHHSYTSNKLSIENWNTHVILPLIHYYGDDFEPLHSWLFLNPDHLSGIHPSKKYQVWKHTIQSIVQTPYLQFDNFKIIIEYYLASCYYFAVYFENDEKKVSSVELTKIYDTIIETLDLITTEKKHIELSSNSFKDLFPVYDSLQEFIESNTNPIRPLFIEPNGSSIATLKEIVTTCQELYPINRLTISKYLHLKYSAEPMKEKEVLQIFSGINSNNSSQLLTSVDSFISNFINEPKESTKINKLIIGRLLFSNFFDLVESRYSSKIEANEYFELVLEKYWDSFNNASNFNEKIGKLHDAAKCVEILDKVSNRSDLSQVNKHLIIRFKHLFKAMANMKNFRIAVEKNKPFTPYQLVNNFGPSESNTDQIQTLHLINIILEQNPKSYVAFEKLYRILNDLLIYFDIDTSKNSTYYFNKLKSACIESSLIDNNFTFAYEKCLELLQHYQKNDDDLNDIWLTFYQVGKYISPSWYEDDISDKKETEKVKIWLQQRELLSRTLEFTYHSDSSSDNSKVILSQWDRINEQIEEYYSQSRLDNLKQSQTSNQLRTLTDVKENIGNLANEIILDATATTNNASEKISNLFVSGLGWAIGANQHH
ncbi:Sec39 domain-containing protein [Scheffersomyces coipomensis]|uniref:Sec39 domain-containing protein n=1 Tax=Scheffersomyces coipomensis TaxID=1788519 RepID=UPI00315DD179